MLSNPRHERFAHLLVAGKSRVEAYTGAGYRGGRAEAQSLVTPVTSLPPGNRYVGRVI